MKIFLFVAIILIVFFSCKKNDSEPNIPSPPIEVADSTFAITNIVKVDINEYDISCQIKPPLNEAYSNVILLWSTSPDFIQDRDSLVLSTSITSKFTNTYHLKGLKQATKYYSRLTITYKSKKFNSEALDFITKSLVIDNPSYISMINKNDTVLLFTNFQNSPNNSVQGTEVSIGSYICPVVSDFGNNIYFTISDLAPAGKYILTLKRKGIVSQKEDSIELLRGIWSRVNPPNIPVNPAAELDGLVFFGNCYSELNGYMIGGTFVSGSGAIGPEANNSSDIYQFNLQSESWIKRQPPEKKYFEKPICYYHDNSIYVIGGIEIIWEDLGYTLVEHRMFLKKMKRLDLNTLKWHEMDPLPFPSIINMTSFELNGEWYIGMGSDSANRSICCGMPIPSKKVWKYSPLSNLWTEVANFPGGHQTNPTCFSIGNKGYAFYGAIPIGDPNNTSDYTQELWEYDSFINSWKFLSLPNSGGPPPGERYSIVVQNDKALFLTAQKRELFSYFYAFVFQNPCLEYDPLSGAFKKIGLIKELGILNLIGKSNNKFYFQNDAFGYFQQVENKTFSFEYQ